MCIESLDDFGLCRLSRAVRTSYALSTWLYQCPKHWRSVCVYYVRKNFQIVLCALAHLLVHSIRVRYVHVCMYVRMCAPVSRFLSLCVFVFLAFFFSLSLSYNFYLYAYSALHKEYLYYAIVILCLSHRIVSFHIMYIRVYFHTSCT